MLMKLVDQISLFLGIPKATVDEWSQDITYKKISIPKKTEGTRIIYVPNNNLKIIQYSIANFLFINEKYFPINRIAIAYRKGIQSPIKRSVQYHSKYPYTVKIDMKDFFPSIKFDDFYKSINKDTIFSDRENIEFIEKCCFVESSFLGIGAPSSPIISNIVMHKIDSNIFDYSSKKNAFITRYADDIMFSSNRKNDCIDFEKYIIDLLSKIDSPLLKINFKKTKYMSKSNRRQILGLIITPEGNISVGREKKRQVRAMIHQYDNLDDTGEYYLSGYLNYLCDVEIEFINKIMLKYGASLIQKIRKFNGNSI